MKAFYKPRLGWLFFLLLISWASHAQVLLDDFNRNDSSIVGNGWSEINSSFFGPNYSRIVSHALRITADNKSGDFVYRDVSSLYKTTLDSNINVLIWAFNMHQTQPDPNGFNDSNSNGIGFVLGTTDIIYPKGYAVVVGQPGTTDPIRLVNIDSSFSIGNNALDDIIASGDYSNEYLSVKVTYNPVGSEWKLYVESRLDSFPQRDPRLTNTLVGTAIESLYTDQDLKYLGMDWHHTESATDFATFDDVYIPNADSPLPVSLLSFTGKRAGNGVQLDWKTTNEINNAGFEVQRSGNLPDFVPIGYIPAVSQSQTLNTYAFTDENYRPGSYYRLKQLDQDGQYEYSKTIFVKGNSSVTVNGLLLYPIPTEGKIHLSLPDATEAHLTLVSVHGTVLADFTALPSEADEQLSRQLNKLPGGIYVLHTTQGNQTYRNQLVKR